MEFQPNGGLKTKFLDVEATKVDVSIEIDSLLDHLIKQGKESLKIDHLGDVAKTEVEKSSGAFTATIEDIEKKIAKEVLMGKETDKKIKEANEVLKHYAKIVEANVNAAVQKEWMGYLFAPQAPEGFSDQVRAEAGARHDLRESPSVQRC